MAVFGRYTLLRRVAAGGMAEIWKAKVLGPAGFSKTVAIKRVLPHLVDDQEFISMFIEEAKLAAELVHPNIVQVFDFGQVGPTDYFLAMEYVPGTNVGKLHKRARERGGRIPAGVALYLIAESAKGLAYAHAKTDPAGKPLGLVHRDISPQNLLVSFGGEVKVGDFGIAKAAGSSSRTAEGFVRGKLSYMSPEQALGQSLDGRSDLFSLGIILYELLSGRKLFEGTQPEVYSKVAGFQGLSPEALAGIPPELHSILKRCLGPVPGGRYPDGVEMERAMTAVLGTDGLVRARQGLSSIVASLFDEEKKLEQTPTGDAEPTLGAPMQAARGAAGAFLGTETATTPLGSIATARGDTALTPTTPAPFTLASSVSKVRPERVAPPAAEPPSRSWLIPAVATAACLVAVTAGTLLGWGKLHGKAGPAAASATPFAVAPAGSSAPSSTPAIPTPSAAPTASATRVASVRPALPRANAKLSVFSRPWVEVFVDGRLATQQTPLTDFHLSSGPHRLRFVNTGLAFDQSRQVEVSPEGSLEVSIDVRKGTIQIR